MRLQETPSHVCEQRPGRLEFCELRLPQSINGNKKDGGREIAKFVIECNKNYNQPKLIIQIRFKYFGSSELNYFHI